MKPPVEAPSSTASPALTYFAALRGLNLSLVEALSVEVDKNPFVDLVSGEAGLVRLREKYEEHRRKIVKDYESAGGKPSEVNGKGEPEATVKKSAASIAPAPAPASAPELPKVIPWSMPAPSTSSATSLNGADSSATTTSTKSEPKEAAIAPPAPPATFTWGGNAVKAPERSKAPTGPVAGGFVFDASKPKDPYLEKSAFSFPVAATPSSSPSAPAPPASSAAPASTPAAPVKTPATAPTAKNVSKLQNAPAAPSPLRFGESVSPPPVAIEDKKKAEEGQDAKPLPPPFSFGATFGSIAKGETAKGKDEAKKSETASAPTAPAAAFSFNPISATSTASAPSNSFGGFSTTGSGGFGFGSATSTPIKVGGGSKPQASPPIATGFGSGSPPSFGFGAALTGVKKDLNGAVGDLSPGFSFGGSSFGSAGSTSSFAPVTGFSFGAGPNTSAAAPAPTAASETAASTPAASGGEDTEAEASGADEPSSLSGRGAGEEDEEVVHEVRAKVHKFAVPPGSEADAPKEWSVVGLGVVAIKAKEVDGKKVRRVLCRSEGGGVVLLVSVGRSQRIRLVFEFG